MEMSPGSKAEKNGEKFMRSWMTPLTNFATSFPEKLQASLNLSNEQLTGCFFQPLVK